MAEVTTKQLAHRLACTAILSLIDQDQKRVEAEEAPHVPPLSDELTAIAVRLRDVGWPELKETDDAGN